MPVKITYQEVPLFAVLNEYAKKITLPEGATLYSHEAFIDQAKRMVVYRLFINDGECEGGPWQSSNTDPSVPVCTKCGLTFANHQKKA